MKKETQWVKAKFGLWELRPGRRAILHELGGSFGRTDYTVDEIRNYANHGDWKYVSEETAADILVAIELFRNT